MPKVLVIEIGDSLGIALPEATVTRLGIAPGQTLWLTETAGGISLSVYDPEYEEQLRVGEKIMDQYRGTLRELAKGPGDD
jgi:putative addiction module antidote